MRVNLPFEPSAAFTTLNYVLTTQQVNFIFKYAFK